MRQTIIILVTGCGIFLIAVSLFYMRAQNKNAIESTQTSSQQIDSTQIKLALDSAFKSRLSKVEDCIQIATASLKKAKKSKNNYLISESYRVLGVCNSFLEQPTISINYLMKALIGFRQISDYDSEARTYLNLGNLYREIDYFKARRYFEHALSLSRTKKLKPEILAGIYMNLASLYQDKTQYSKSLMYFEKSFEIFKTLNNQSNLVLYFQNTGVIYYHLKNYPEAIWRLDTAISRSKKNKLYFNIIGSNATKSLIYRNQQKYDLALEAVKEGLFYANKIDHSRLRNNLLYYDFEIEKESGNLKSALAKLQAIRTQDSLLLAKYLSQNLGIKTTSYLQQAQLKEHKLTIINQQYKETKFWWAITLMIAGILLLLLIFSSFYIFQLKKRKKERLITESEMTLLEQKAIQAMMNPHFIFNVMTSIQHFINIADQRSANALLTGFASLIRKHLELCIHSTVSVRNEIEYLRLYLAMEQTRFGNQLKYQLKIDKKIDLDEVMIPSMLIQPYVENAIWHGIMPLDKPGKLTIEIKLSGDFLYITVIDNGIGILNSKKTKKPGHISRGMELTKSRVSLMNKLNPRAIVISQEQTKPQGTRVQINLPV